MEYRMYSGDIPAGKNAIELIKQHLEEQKQIKMDKLVLNFIGFEGAAGTTFTLNQQKDKIVIPQCGYFITPHDGHSYMKITSLIFEQDFNGNIYYIM